MKKYIIFTCFMFLAIAAGKACSCAGPLYFCEYIRDTTVKIAFQARVIEKKDYGSDNLTIYLQILKRYKSNLQTTDTIKLYGRTVDADCSVNVHQDFYLGDTIMIAMGELYDYSPIVNPDSTREKFSGFRPFSCASAILRVKAGQVSGRIREGVFNWPMRDFDERLSECNFPIEYKCLDENLTVFPNPSVNGKITIQGKNWYELVEKVRVFSIDGKLLGEYQNLIGTPRKAIEIEGFGIGWHVLEIQCSGKQFYRKVLVFN